MIITGVKYWIVFYHPHNDVHVGYRVGGYKKKKNLNNLHISARHDQWYLILTAVMGFITLPNMEEKDKAV